MRFGSVSPSLPLYAHTVHLVSCTYFVSGQGHRQPIVVQLCVTSHMVITGLDVYWATRYIANNCAVYVVSLHYTHTQHTAYTTQRRGPSVPLFRRK